MAEPTEEDIEAGGWVVERHQCYFCGYRYVSVHPVRMALETGYECGDCGLMTAYPEEDACA